MRTKWLGFFVVVMPVMFGGTTTYVVVSVSRGNTISSRWSHACTALRDVRAVRAAEDLDGRDALMNEPLGSVPYAVAVRVRGRVDLEHVARVERDRARAGRA